MEAAGRIFLRLSQANDPFEKGLCIYFSHCMKMTNTGLFAECRVCCEKKTRVAYELTLDSYKDRGRFLRPEY